MTCSFKAQFPENTMKAFEGAVKAGAHAIETDLHISKDGVVMISHDATLQRCYGVNKKIIDCDYAYLRTLRTLEAPHVPMPTLEEVFKFMCKPAVQKMWLLLDIKVDNNPDDIMRLIAETFRAVHGSESLKSRIVLGCWTLKYLPLCDKYLFGFPIVYIGRSIYYAREFLKYPGVSFNLHWAVLSCNSGQSFLREAKDAGRNVFAWTVNNDAIMKWAISEDLLDVCTDDPAKFLELCGCYTESWKTETWSWGVRSRWVAQLMFSWVAIAFLQWRYIFGDPSEKGVRTLDSSPAPARR
ncbi:putative glycerophosphoryl diester phosphodiesterase [Geopyxis carbonaria]|nr:putative glycerophosphoryl diester phosphodiesterase [Geopyxis carbonaria]